MSSSWETDSDPELDELVTVCLLKQCLGCSCCQNAEFLTASRLIEELKKKIKDATEEIDFLVQLRRLRCNHHLILDRTAEVCARCGLHRTRLTETKCHRKGAKCVRDGCENEAEQGLCPKDLKPKRACSYTCYRAWKEQREAVNFQHVGKHHPQGDGHAPAEQEVSGIEGAVRPGRAAGERATFHPV
jgi:hypothetical protein